MALKCLAGAVLAVVSVASCGGGAPQSDTKGWRFEASPNAPTITLSPQGHPSFPFPAFDGVHYLTNNVLSGTQFMSAAVTVEVEGLPVFDYPRPGNSCPTAPNWGLYFQRRGDRWTGLGDQQFYRWWHTRRTPLRAGTTAVTANLANPAEWSSVMGVRGSDAPEKFFEAVKDMGAVGVTFGGGCFYSHGVFVTGPGSATFSMMDFQVY